MKHYLEQGDSLELAYYKSLKTTGKAVSFTGITLAIGVSSWIFSPIKFQADMGILLTFMFIFNMIGALCLMPALVKFLVRAKSTTKIKSAVPVSSVSTVKGV